MTSAQLKSRCRLLVGVAAVVMLLALLHGCAARTQPAPPASAPLPPPPRTEPPPESAPGQPRPYKALGKWYQPIPDAKGFRQQGCCYRKDKPCTQTQGNADNFLFMHIPPFHDNLELLSPAS